MQSLVVFVRALVGLILLSLALSPSKASSISATSSRQKRSFASRLSFRLARGGSSKACDGKAVVSSNRRACGFFVWDLPSAVLYRWCHHLLKDRIYEGRGGYLFVRYESNSVLQLLYPCSRYSPNKCMICGGSYPDHLELWWSKHLYSPFDQHLDKTYNDALTTKDEMEAQNNYHRGRYNARKGSKKNDAIGIDRNRKTSPGTSSSSTAQSYMEPPIFGFHKPYVEDISHLHDIEDKKQKRRLIKKFVKTLPSNRDYDVRRVPGTKVMYVTPGIGGFTNKKDYTKKDAFIDVLTLMLGASVDSMIFRQAKEFESEKHRNSKITNRL